MSYKGIGLIVAAEESVFLAESHQPTPQVVVCVPGVTTLLGEFAYHGQGKVLCCANNQNLTVRLFSSPDSQIHVFNSFTGDKKKFSLTSLKYRKEDKWANYVKGILLQLSEFGVHLKPFSMIFDGSVLKNDGATLAAAVSVGVCLALKSYLGFDVDERDIALLCYKSCTSYSGELTKFSTVLTMLVAQTGKYILFDMDTLTHVMLDDPFNDGKCSIYLVDCRIPPTALREEIVIRHRQIHNAFERLRAIYPHSLRDFPLNDLVDRTIPLDEESRRICYAVLEDKLAASSMQKLLPARDYIQIGKSFTKVGKLLRDDLEISCPEIDWLIKRALEVPLCYGATIAFNGDNVYVAMLAEPSALPVYDSKLEDYERIFGFKARISELHPCDKWAIQGVR